MEFLYIKSLHIIFVVTWFAGLFYLPRIFIYHTEAFGKDALERDILVRQFKLMAKKLWYIITWPSAVLALTFGIWMLVLRPAYLQEPWMHLKLAFVAGLVIYHVVTGIIFYNLQHDQSKVSSLSLRLWNEVATILLIAIVFIVILRDMLSWVWGVVGIMLLASLLTLSVMLYKKRRAARLMKQQEAPQGNTTGY